MEKNKKWIYLAGPLFSSAEQSFNQDLCERLEEDGYKIYLPQRECEDLKDAADIYQKCIDGVKGSCLVVAILDGSDADSGTCFEVGFAHANNIPILGLRTDFRGSGDDGGLNLMLTKSCSHLIVASFQDYSKENTSYIKPGDEFYTLLVEQVNNCI